MRWARRPGERAVSVPETPSPADDAPPVPTAVYARILDGETLWLAVDGAADQVGLRREGGADIVVPDSDSPAAPGLFSLRWHLPTALPGPTGGLEVFEVVTVPGAAPLQSRPLPEQAPMRTPPTSDGRWLLDVRRREGGALVVRREPRPDSVETAAVAVAPEGVSFTFTGPGLDAPRLLLVDADGEALAVRPATREGDLFTALVRAEDVPPESGPHWFLAVADGDRVLPLVRLRNDCLMPGQATVLPLLWTDADEGRSLVRFQYQREGRVRVNRPASGDEETT
jgi:hypothetical protein